MLKLRIKHLILALAIALSGSLVVAPALASAADLKGDACAGLNALSSDTANTNCSSNGTRSINNILAVVINILSIIVGVAAVIMIIIGGFNYVTSSGESSNTASAKNTIIYALVGLVIVVLAQVLVHFVLTKTTAATMCTVPGKTSLSASDPNCR